MDSLKQVIKNQFYSELARISETHTSRRAKFGQNVLAYLNANALTMPEIATEAKKLLINGNNYTGEFWLDDKLTGRTTGELSLISTLNKL